MKFIDTHAHMYFRPLDQQIDEIVSGFLPDGLCHAIQVAVDLESCQTCVDLARRCPEFSATIGVHPTDAQNLRHKDLESAMQRLEELYKENKDYIVAIGEIGLDYHHTDADFSKSLRQKELQELFFIAQVELARRYDLPCVIHIRECEEDMLELIKKTGLKKFVTHCFSADWWYAQELFEYSDDAMISFTGILTYPDSRDIQEVARRAPLSRIMIETDCPFLVPEPLRGKEKHSLPSHTRYVLEKLIELRDEPAEEVEKQVYENSIRFFSLRES